MSLKNIVIGIAILILTIFVGVYGISTLYGEQPRYEDYCPVLNTQAECEAFGGLWNNYEDSISVKPVPVRGSCDVYNVCREPFENAERKYARNIFLIALPLGIVAIAVGILVFGLEAVGAGLMGGGVGIIIYGAGNYWRFADDWLKFVLSLVGLVVVIWLAYWFNKRMHQKKVYGFNK